MLAFFAAGVAAGLFDFAGWRAINTFAVTPVLYAQ
jgi:hypothetical protein